MQKSTNRAIFKWLIYLPLGLLLVYLPLAAQNSTYNFKQYTTEDGLADGQVHNILMDSKGIVWFVTHDGLSRFDGHHFKNYKVNNKDSTALPGAVLMDIKEDSNDIFWIACNGIGLIRFDAQKEKFTTFDHQAEYNNSLSNNATTSIFKDKDNKIWVGTFVGGLNLFDPEKSTFQRFMVNESEIPLGQEFMYNSVRDIIPDPTNPDKLWLATHRGILHFDKITKEKTTYPLKMGPDPAFTVSLIAEADGILWVATEGNGLLKFNTITKNFESVSESLAIKDLARKSSNELYVACQGVGVGIFNTETNDWKYITTESTKRFNLLSNDVYGIYVDQNENLWVRDKHFGVVVSPSTGVVFQSPIFSNQLKESLTGIKKFAFDRTHQELFVVSNSNGYLFQFRKQEANYVYNQTILPFNQDSAIASNMLDVFTDVQSRTWVLLKGEGEMHLFQYNRNANQLEEQQIAALARLNHSAIDYGSILKDKEGNIWLIFQNGQIIGLLPNNIVEKQIGQDLIPDGSPEIWTGIFDQENKLWATSLMNGVIKLDLENGEESHYAYSADIGIEAWRILSVAQLPDGKIWIGTSAAGIQEIRPNMPLDHHKPVYNQLNGLPDDKISGIQLDPKGYVWISTMRGLIRYNPNANHFRQFGKKSGINVPFLEHGFKQLSNGDLLIGQPNGFTVLDPKKVPEITETKSVFISDFLIDGLSFVKEFGKNKTKKLSLNPDQNYFTILFSTGYSPETENIRYRYILEGFDRNWTETNPGIALANFTRVPPGNYTFKVLAANNDGHWGKVPTNFQITIQSPWYSSNLAILFYCLCFLICVYLVYRFQKNRWQLQTELEIEKREALRLKGIDELKSNFFANVSHELRTPLTLMLAPVSSVLKNNNLKRGDYNLLKKSQQSGKELLKLVGSILDLSKLESNKLTTKNQPVSLYKLSHRLATSFDSQAQYLGIQYTFSYLAEKDLVVSLDKEKLSVIINNLLSNAFRFTPKNGKVSLEVVDMGSQLQFTVVDTGRGIHPEDIDHIFNRFFQSNRANEIVDGGTGIGLSLSKEFAVLMDGGIEVQSELGQGSTFILRIKHLKAAIQDIEAPHYEEEMELISSIVDNQQLPSSPSNGKGTSKFKLLIVEDNFGLRDYMKDILSHYYVVQTAKNGLEALDLLAEIILEKEQNKSASLPDLILSDLMMPVMDGFQFLRILKSKEYFRHIPVIMLTARSDREKKLSALRIGVDDYLLKPFEEDELLVRIENLIKNNQERIGFLNLEKPTEEQEASLKPIISREDNDWLASLEELVKINLSFTNYSIAQLAKKLAMSERSLQRKLKALTGLTPSQFLTEIRLNEARRLLETKQYNGVAKVAYAVGFSNQKAFSRRYKKRFGKLPSEY